nr:hypothetical protein [Bacteroidota bacterium]
MEWDNLLANIEEWQSKLITLQNNGKEFIESIDKLKIIHQLLYEAKDEAAKVDIRLRLQTQVKKICSSIEIFPKQKILPGHKILEKNPRYLNARISDKLNKRNRPEGYYDKLKNLPPIERELDGDEYDYIIRFQHFEKLVIRSTGTAKAKILY